MGRCAGVSVFASGSGSAVGRGGRLAWARSERSPSTSVREGSVREGSSPVLVLATRPDVGATGRGALTRVLLRVVAGAVEAG